MKELLFGGVRFNSVVGDLGVFILRVFAGTSLALAHGLAKLPPSEGFIGGVVRMGLPGEMAYLSAFVEFAGGLALAAGFLTRPAALAIAINMATAGFLSHATDPYARAELAFLFLAVAVMFVCVGAGRFSVDRLMKR